jgi:hypothetical protein
MKKGNVAAAAGVIIGLGLAGAALAGTLADSQARLKIGQEALAAADAEKAIKYCEAAVLGLPYEPSADGDLVTADGTECQAKGLIAQGKNQEACDLLSPVIDMMGVSQAANKTEVVARLKGVIDTEVAAKRCQ